VLESFLGSSRVGATTCGYGERFRGDGRVLGGWFGGTRSVAAAGVEFVEDGIIVAVGGRWRVEVG